VLRSNQIIDNLPAASIVESSGYVETSYSKGFPVGFKAPRGWSPEQVQAHDEVPPALPATLAPRWAAAKQLPSPRAPVSVL
jgi:hypothetical protein